MKILLSILLAFSTQTAFADNGANPEVPSLEAAELAAKKACTEYTWNEVAAKEPVLNVVTFLLAVGPVCAKAMADAAKASAEAAGYTWETDFQEKQDRRTGN